MSGREAGFAPELEIKQRTTGRKGTEEPARHRLLAGGMPRLGDERREEWKGEGGHSGKKSGGGD